MKPKAVSFFLILMLTLSIAGCAPREKNTNVNLEELNRHKLVIVVVDKETKAPVKEAKVYLIGDPTVYTTDEMGKTPEIQVDLNKDYFAKYMDEVSSKMRSGFVNVVVNKEGYSKHLETDCSVYPGDSISVVKVQISKGKAYDANSNAPDLSYVENIVKAYENFEGEGNKADNMLKYKVAVTDENNKPLEGVKVVIPEARISGKTNKSGVCEMNIPYDDTCNVNYPVKKEYGEITIVTYKEGYPSKVYLRAQLKKDGKNSMAVKVKKSNRIKVEYEVLKPDDKWVKSIIESFNK